ncbi:MAG: hypothetical protein AB7K37_14255 [Cyclobacteriaceae bacterium]
MKTLNWKHTDWSARNFIFSIGQEIVGQLTFYSAWNYNAVYTDKETKLTFVQKSAWNRNVVIKREGETIGEIDFQFFGNQTLKLASGACFTLSTNAWGRNVQWKASDGQTVVKYQQATLSSMGKGVISLADSLALDTEKLLICSGLFVRQLIHKRVALTVAILVPIIAASSR